VLAPHRFWVINNELIASIMALFDRKQSLILVLRGLNVFGANGVASENSCFHLISISYMCHWFARNTHYSRFVAILFSIKTACYGFVSFKWRSAKRWINRQVNMQLSVC